MDTQHYKDNNPNQMILRDHLAFDRTVLAVERTALAYIRTAIVSFASGITVLKLFPDDKTFTLIGYLGLGITLIMLVLGSISFIKSRKRLKQVYIPSQKQE